MKQELPMRETTSLRQLTGMPDTPAPWPDQTLVLIDCQNTYTRGILELDGVQQALDAVAELLDGRSAPPGSRWCTSSTTPARDLRTTCAPTSEPSSIGW